MKMDLVIGSLLPRLSPVDGLTRHPERVARRKLEVYCVSCPTSGRNEVFSERGDGSLESLKHWVMHKVGAKV